MPFDAPHPDSETTRRSTDPLSSTNAPEDVTPQRESRVESGNVVDHANGQPARYEEAMALAQALQGEIRKTVKAGSNPEMMKRCLAVGDRLEAIAPRFAIDVIHIRRLASSYYGEGAGVRRNRSQGARARLIKALDIIIREASLFNGSSR
jgi:hypothetical protein